MIKPNIVIDFDDTISQSGLHHSILGLQPGVKEALKELSKHYLILIQSARMNAPEPEKALQEMKDFLDKNNVYYDHICDKSEGKPMSMAYIDDKAYRYENNWNEITKSLTSPEFLNRVSILLKDLK